MIRYIKIKISITSSSSYVDIKSLKATSNRMKCRVVVNCCLVSTPSHVNMPDCQHHTSQDNVDSSWCWHWWGDVDLRKWCYHEVMLWQHCFMATSPRVNIISCRHRLVATSPRVNIVSCQHHRILCQNHHILCQHTVKFMKTQIFYLQKKYVQISSFIINIHGNFNARKKHRQSWCCHLWQHVSWRHQLSMGTWSLQ